MIINAMNKNLMVLNKNFKKMVSKKIQIYLCNKVAFECITREI